jgi:hypothetical protein
MQEPRHHGAGWGWLLGDAIYRWPCRCAFRHNLRGGSAGLSAELAEEWGCFDGWEGTLNAEARSWSLLPPARIKFPRLQVRRVYPRPKAQGPSPIALPGRRALGAIGDPCRRSTGWPIQAGAAEQPPIAPPNLTGLPGLPQIVGTLSCSAIITAVPSSNPHLAKAGRPESSYLVYIPTYLLTYLHMYLSTYQPT